MTPRCIVVQHLSAEHAGCLRPAIERAGYSVSTVLAGAIQDARQRVLEADLVLVMGGPIGVYDDRDFPFVKAEIDIIRERAGRDGATLGICLGCQMLAAALGARVYPGSAGFEIGWGPVNLTDAGRAHPIAQAAGEHTQVLHWHGDTFDLPTGATLLASTGRYANQAFAAGSRQLGLQFHVEVDSDELEDWLVTFSADIRRLSPALFGELRGSRQDNGTRQRRSADFVEAWINQIK